MQIFKSNVSSGNRPKNVKKKESKVH